MGILTSGPGGAGESTSDIDPSLAPIQPISVWLTDGWRLSTLENPSEGSADYSVNFFDKGITSLSADALAALTAILYQGPYLFSSFPIIDLRSNALDTATIDALAAMASAVSVALALPIRVWVYGGTNAIPTLQGDDPNIQQIWGAGGQFLWND